MEEFSKLVVILDWFVTPFERDLRIPQAIVTLPNLTMIVGTNASKSRLAITYAGKSYYSSPLYLRAAYLYVIIDFI